MMSSHAGRGAGAGASPRRVPQGVQPSLDADGRGAAGRERGEISGEISGGAWDSRESPRWHVQTAVRWPTGTYLDWTLSASRGKALGGQESFLASFSNHGAKVALTAPGVGVVSTIFGSRWGIMSGTSMATPIATGVLSRRLAASPAVKDLPRDATRSAEIVKMALQAAEDIHLPAGMQGNGLAR